MISVICEDAFVEHPAAVRPWQSRKSFGHVTKIAVLRVL
jgi:hypothetical protein